MYRSEVEHDNLTGSANVTVTDSAYVTLNGELTTIPLPAVVTGGARGIGRSIAIAMAAEGARVALAARSEDSILCAVTG